LSIEYDSLLERTSDLEIEWNSVLEAGAGIRTLPVLLDVDIPSYLIGMIVQLEAKPVKDFPPRL